MKQRIEKDEGYEAQLQQLIFTGEVWSPSGTVMAPDDATCNQFNIKEGDQIRLLMCSGYTSTVSYRSYNLFKAAEQDGWGLEQEDLIKTPAQTHSLMTLNDLKKLIHHN